KTRSIGVWPRIATGLSMPSRVIANASSTQFTPSQSALSATIGATVSRPCPYALALTTTISAVPRAVTVLKASMLFRSRSASISIQDNMRGLFHRDGEEFGVRRLNHLITINESLGVIR